MEALALFVVVMFLLAIIGDVKSELRAEIRKHENLTVKHDHTSSYEDRWKY